MNEESNELRPRLMLYAFLAALVFSLAIDGAHYVLAESECTTDEECARHCPPPADDPDCDGGPQ